MEQAAPGMGHESTLSLSGEGRLPTADCRLPRAEGRGMTLIFSFPDFLAERNVEKEKENFDHFR